MLKKFNNLKKGGLGFCFFIDIMSAKNSRIASILLASESNPLRGCSSVAPTELLVYYSLLIFLLFLILRLFVIPSMSVSTTRKFTIESWKDYRVPSELKWVLRTYRYFQYESISLFRRIESFQDYRVPSGLKWVLRTQVLYPQHMEGGSHTQVSPQNKGAFVLTSVMEYRVPSGLKTPFGSKMSTLYIYLYLLFYFLSYIKIIDRVLAGLKWVLRKYLRK